MTPEEILNKHVHLYFSSHHDKSQWNGEGEHGGAEWHTDKAIAFDIYKAMDEYAKQQAIAFDKWKLDFGWAKEYGNNFTYIRSELVEGSHKFNYIRISFDDLYNQFIEQQNKDNA